MIYTYLQIRLFVPSRYKSCVPRYKSFVPIFKYGWHGNIHYFIVDGCELNLGRLLGTNDLNLSSNNLICGYVVFAPSSNDL